MMDAMMRNGFYHGCLAIADGRYAVIAHSESAAYDMWEYGAEERAYISHTMTDRSVFPAGEVQIFGLGQELPLPPTAEWATPEQIHAAHPGLPVGAVRDAVKDQMADENPNGIFGYITQVGTWSRESDNYLVNVEKVLDAIVRLPAATVDLMRLPPIDAHRFYNKIQHGLVSLWWSEEKLITFQPGAVRVSRPPDLFSDTEKEHIIFDGIVHHRYLPRFVRWELVDEASAGIYKDGTHAYWVAEERNSSGGTYAATITKYKRHEAAWSLLCKFKAKNGIR